MTSPSSSQDPEAIRDRLREVRANHQRLIRQLRPAIRRIVEKYPNEAEAAPSLRALAVKHGARRHAVFAEYRHLMEQESPTDE